jgi:hypothetical protein
MERGWTCVPLRQKLVFKASVRSASRNCARNKQARNACGRPSSRPSWGGLRTPETKRKSSSLVHSPSKRLSFSARCCCSLGSRALPSPSAARRRAGTAPPPLGPSPGGPPLPPPPGEASGVRSAAPVASGAARFLVGSGRRPATAAARRRRRGAAHGRRVEGARVPPPPSPLPPVQSGHVSSLPPVHVSSLPPVQSGHVSSLYTDWTRLRGHGGSWRGAAELGGGAAHRRGGPCLSPPRARCWNHCCRARARRPRRRAPPERCRPPRPCFVAHRRVPSAFRAARRA